MKRIIWTRPEEDWELDQRWLKSEAQLLRFPVTRQVEIVPQLPPKPCDAVLLTSRKAADAFLHRVAVSREQMQKIDFFTFGMETYKFLLGHKLRAHLISAQNGKEFAAALVDELKKDAVIWFPKPLETAYPLSDHMRQNQFEIYDLELYKTEAIKQIDTNYLSKLQGPPAVVCFASPLAVKSFIDIVRIYDDARFSRYTPVAIGATTMASGQSYFKDFYMASQSTLQSLWEKALELSREGEARRAGL